MFIPSPSFKVTSASPLPLLTREQVAVKMGQSEVTDTDALFRGLDARLKERTSQIGHAGQSHLSTRTLALMTLDPYLRASGLEGGSLAEMAEALLPFCDSNVRGHLDQLVATDREIKQLREGESALENVANYVATQVKELRVGQSALIPGGWHAKPFGHAMLYQFTRTAAGFSIHVFNTGGGSDLCHLFKFTGNKEKIEPVIHFKDVPEDTLFLYDETLFFRGLLQPLIPNLSHNRFPEEFAKDIYHKVLKSLFSYRSETGHHFLITSQRSGTCTYKVFKAFILVHLDDQNRYKKLFLTVRHQALISFVNGHKDLLFANSPDGERARSVVQLASKKLLRAVAKHYREGADSILTEKEAEDIFVTVRDIQRLEHDQKPLSKELGIATFVDPEKQILTAEWWNLRNVPQVKADYIPKKLLPSIRGCPPEQFPDVLHQWLALPQDNWHDAEADRRIEECAFALSLDPSYWKKVPDHMRVLEKLHNALNAYVQRNTQQHTRTPVVLYSLIAAMHLLAQQIDPELKDFGIDDSGLDTTRLGAWNTFYEKEIFDRWKQLKGHFSAMNENKTLLFGWRAQELTLEKLAQDPDLKWIWKKASAQLKVEYFDKARRYTGLPEQLHREVKTLLPLAEAMFSEYGLSQEPALCAYARCLQAAIHGRVYAGEAKEAKVKWGLGMRLKVVLMDNEGVTITVCCRGENVPQPAIHRTEADHDMRTLRAEVAHRLQRKTEGNILTTKRDPTLREAYLKAAAAELSPYKILNLFSHDLQALTNPEEQTVLYNHLFSPYKDTIPLQEELPNNLKFREQFQKFISKGIDFFDTKGREPNISVLLFFIDVARRAALITGIPELIPELDVRFSQWLHHFRRKDHCAEIHLRVVLNEIVKPTWNWPKLLNSLTSLQEARRRNSLKLPFELNAEWGRAHLKVIDAFAKLTREQQITTIEALAKQKGIPHPQIRWMGELAFKINESGRFDCVEGALSEGSEPLYTDFDPEKMRRNYPGSDVFGDMPLRATGNNFHGTLTHPTMGEMRYWYDEMPDTTRIERKVDGQWWRAINKQQPNTPLKTLPEPFKKYFQGWIRTDEQQEMVLAKCRSGEFCYRMDANGDLYELETGYRLSRKPPPLLADFENPEWTCVWVDGKGEPKRLDFPAFEPPLSFTIDAGVCRLSDSPNWILTENQPQSPLGHFKSYLYIQKEDSAEAQLIIPLTPIAISHPYTTKLTLKTDKDKSDPTQRVILRIRGDTVEPLTPDARIKLLEIYYTTRNYDKALDLLEEMPVGEQLSIGAQTILFGLLQGADRSPEAVGFLLHLYCFLNEQKNRPDIRIEMKRVRLDDLQTRYQDLIHNIPPRFRFKEARAAQPSVNISQCFIKTRPTIDDSLLTLLENQQTLETIPCDPLKLDTSLASVFKDLYEQMVDEDPKKRNQAIYLFHILAENGDHNRDLFGQSYQHKSLVAILNLRARNGKDLPDFSPTQGWLSQIRDWLSQDTASTPCSPSFVTHNGAFPEQIVQESTDRSVTIPLQPTPKQLKPASPKKEGELPKQSLGEIPQLVGDETDCEEAVRREFDDFHTDLQLGAQKNQQRQSASLQQLKRDSQKESELLVYANFAPTLTSALLRNGEVTPHFTFDALVLLYMKNRFDLFQRGNPHLSFEQIRQLNQALQNYLVAATDHPDRVFEPHQYPFFLGFEFLTGMRIRQEQFDRLEKLLETDDSGNYKDRVIQLIMGGGKTDLIAAILVALQAARPGRLSAFFVPSAQYGNVVANMRKGQYQKFRQKVDAIDFPRKALKNDNLKWLEERLHSMMENEEVVILKPEFLQSLELEMLATARKGNNEEKLMRLIRILNLFRTQCDALIDEIHIILHSLKEVNFPDGAKQHIPPDRIKLMQTIFEWLVEQDALGLTRNQQNESGSLFEQTLRPKLAHVLANDLKLEERKDDFIRYVTGEMQAGDPFEAWLAEVRKSDEERAHLIALAKQLCQTILPPVLTKSANKHFGRMVERAIPFVGVGEPANTEFGDVMESLAYAFSLAAYAKVGICEKQVWNLAYQYSLAALAAVDDAIEEIAIEETTEAKEFKALMGVNFWEIHQKTEEALKFVNETAKRRIKVEAKTAEYAISYFPERLRSTPESFAAQLATIRAMTGTPWPEAGWPERLSKNVIHDQGTLGSIFSEILTRNDRPHHVSSSHPKILISKVLQGHPSPHRIRGLIDVGGLMKDLGGSNLTVANEILLATPQQIQGVLFYHRNENETSSDTLYLFKRNGTVVRIGATDKETIEAKGGLKLEELFVYYDDRHTTGTNIPQVADAINLCTLDPRVWSENAAQGVLRLRQWFDKQNTEFVLTESSRDAFRNRGETVADCLATAVKNLGVEKGRNVRRAWWQKIDEAPRQAVLTQILSLNDPQAITRLVRAQETVLVTPLVDSPYEAYGSLQGKRETLDLIKERIARYPECDLRHLLTSAQECPIMPKMTSTPISSTEGMEMRVLQEQQVEQQQEQQVQQEVQQELQQELSLYSTGELGTVVNELTWSTFPHIKTKPIVTFTWAAWVGSDTTPPIARLDDTCPHTTSTKQLNCQGFFGPNFFATANWLFTGHHPQHLLSPTQKPADHLLMLSSGNDYQFLLVSAQEAVTIKTLLQQTPRNDLWLLQTNGMPYHPTTVPPSPALTRALMLLDVLNGDTFSLRTKMDPFRSWLAEGHTKEKREFLKLKVNQGDLRRRHLLSRLLK